MPIVSRSSAIGASSLIGSVPHAAHADLQRPLSTESIVHTPIHYNHYHAARRLFSSVSLTFSHITARRACRATPAQINKAITRACRGGTKTSYAFYPICSRQEEVHDSHRITLDEIQKMNPCFRHDDAVYGPTTRNAPVAEIAFVCLQQTSACSTFIPCICTIITTCSRSIPHRSTRFAGATRRIQYRIFRTTGVSADDLQASTPWSVVP